MPQLEIETKQIVTLIQAKLSLVTSFVIVNSGRDTVGLNYWSRIYTLSFLFNIVRIGNC